MQNDDPLSKNSRFDTVHNSRPIISAVTINTYLCTTAIFETGYTKEASVKMLNDLISFTFPLDHKKLMFMIAIMIMIMILISLVGTACA